MAAMAGWAHLYDDDEEEEEEEEMALILGPPHQPSQQPASAADFDRSMVYDGRPLVTALLYLAGRLPKLPEYGKVRKARGREMRGTGLVVVVVVVCKHELINE